MPPKPTTPNQLKILNEIAAAGLDVPSEAYTSYEIAWERIASYKSTNANKSPKTARAVPAKDERNPIQRSLDYWKLALRFDRFADLEDATPDQVFTPADFEKAVATTGQ
jgi:hypothetical protein